MKPIGLYMTGIIIAIVTAIQNPFLFSEQVALDYFHRFDTPAPPVLVQPEPAHDITFQFRNSVGRTGESSSHIKFPLKPLFSVEPFNLAVHRAMKSSPAIDADGIFATTDSGWIHAFNFTGQLNWSFQVAEAREGLHATAALDAKSVYVGAYNGRFYRLRKSDGHPLWITRLGGAIGASAALFEEFVYIAVELTGRRADGYVVALNRETGQPIWRSDYLGQQAHSSTTFCDENKVLVVGVNNAQVVGIERESGVTLWRFAAAGPVRGTLTASGSQAFAADGGGRVSAVDCRNGQLIWQRELSAGSASSVAYHRGLDLVIVGSLDGHLSAFSGANGERRWTVDLRQPDYRSGVTITGDTLWTACRTAGVCALSAKSGTVIQHWSLKGAVSSIPTIERGILCVTQDYPGGLSCFRASNEEQWRRPADVPPGRKDREDP